MDTDILFICFIGKEMCLCLGENIKIWWNIYNLHRNWNNRIIYRVDKISFEWIRDIWYIEGGENKWKNEWDIGYIKEEWVD